MIYVNYMAKIITYLTEIQLLLKLLYSFSPVQYRTGLYGKNNIKKLNSVALVRKRTIPTERPPLIGEEYNNIS
jgi:hypothetical protein